MDMQMAGYHGHAEAGLEQMPGFGERVQRLAAVLAACRGGGVPVVHLQEVHRASGVDFGRELDGAEGVHFLEGDPLTDIVPELAPLPGEPHIVKRRYSGFFGTDLQVVLTGLGARSVVLAGELTDVCVHYTYADAHQLGYHAYVVEDCCGGSGTARHFAALDAMAYLQCQARCVSGDVLTWVQQGASETARLGATSL
ncbi:MAG TPA: isochorismatase family cysteine hydrolase [Acidimicrobiales bacterium]|nr:isochorismatase family cysteine hydrolase [Acidimicrobiales bacterium]